MQNRIETNVKRVSYLVVKGALTAAFLLQVAITNARAADWNHDFINTTGNVVNDFHIEFTSATPITLNFQCCTSVMGGGPAYPPATVTGNGTTTMTMDWAGFSLNNGQGIHAGFQVTSASPIQIKRSYWTLGGFEVLPHQHFASLDITGPGSSFLVARVTTYTDQAGTLVTGHSFVQDTGTGVSVTNAGEGPFFASTAMINVGPVPMPIADLRSDNASLVAQLNAVEGPISFFAAPATAVPAMGTWGMALLVLALLLGGAWMIHRRQKVLSA